MYKIKKVALLSSTFFPSIGGVEVGIHNIAIRLASRGIEPIVIAPYSSKNFKHRSDLPYKVIPLPPKVFHLFAFLPESVANFVYRPLYGYLQRKYNFDVWHITMGYPAGVSFLEFGNSNKLPYLVRCAGSDIQKSDIAEYGDRRNKKIDSIVTAKLNKIPRLISISNSVYYEYKKLNVEDKSISHINNGVDIELFNKTKSNREMVCKTYNIPYKNKIFLSVGRNHPKKNFKLLFDVARKLKDQGVDAFTIVIVGDKTDDLSKYYTPDIKDNVLLLPSFGIDFDNGIPVIPHRGLVALYKSCDLFVFPSYIETFGIVLVEAMAAGLPIIAFEVEGCKDLVQTNVNGYLLELDNIELFSEKIMYLMANEDIYNRFRESNLEKAKLFSWEIIVDKYTDVYKSLIESR